MLTQGEGFEPDYQSDPHCDDCGRSIAMVDGDAAYPPIRCDSCESDWRLLQRAGKLRMDGWSLVVVKIGDDLDNEVRVS